MSAHWTQRENLAQAIAELSDVLKMSMPPVNRGHLEAWMDDMRRELASLEGPDTLASLGLSEWEIR